MKRPGLAVALLLAMAELASALGLRVVDTGIILGPGQEVSIMATGTGVITGVNLYIQAGDGGPLAGGTDIPGVDVAPITGVDFHRNASIWGPPGNGFEHVEIYDGLLAFASFLAPEPRVVEPGVLATLILDASGMSVYLRFTVSLEMPAFGVKSDFVGVPADELVPGMVWKEPPEPASMLLMMLGLPLIARRRSR